MFIHETLGKILAALEFGAGFRRAGHKHIVRLKIVVYTGHERVFVAYNNHIYCIVGHKTAYAFKIQRRKLHVGAICSCAAVAWGDIQVVATRTLTEFPCQG